VLFAPTRAGAWPHWCFPEKPRTAAGDVMEFRQGRITIAEAVVALIDRPGVCSRPEGFRHRDRWQVYWMPHTLLDLRIPMRLALLLAFDQQMRKGESVPGNWPAPDTWRFVAMREPEGPFAFICPTDDETHDQAREKNVTGETVNMDPHHFYQSSSGKNVRLWVGRCSVCGQVYWTARPLVTKKAKRP